MLSLLAFRFFPFDPAIDSAMGHRHLIAVYCVIWLAHAAYATYVVKKWMSIRRDESQDSALSKIQR